MKKLRKKACKSQGSPQKLIPQMYQFFFLIIFLQNDSVANSPLTFTQHQIERPRNSGTFVKKNGPDVQRGSELT